MRLEAAQKKERMTLGDAFPKYRISMLDNGRIKRIRVEGAKKLLLCLAGEVKISLGEEVLHVHGDGLACMSYNSGAVEISGVVKSILFEGKTKTEAEH